MKPLKYMTLAEINFEYTSIMLNIASIEAEFISYAFGFTTSEPLEQLEKKLFCYKNDLKTIAIFCDQRAIEPKFNYINK